MIIRLSKTYLETRCRQGLRRLGFKWRQFNWDIERKAWLINGLEVGKDFPECLDNIRFLESKRDIR